MLTFYAASQTPTSSAPSWPTASGLPEHSVRVIAPDVGGGFGIKAHLAAEEVGGRARVDAARPPRQVDGGRPRAPAREQPRPRAHPPRGGGVRRDGTILGLAPTSSWMPGPTRSGRRRPRRRPPRRPTSCPALPGPELRGAHAGRRHQQVPDRRVSRGGPALGRLHHGAADRGHRAAARDRPGRDPAPNLPPGRRVSPHQHHRARVRQREPGGVARTSGRRSATRASGASRRRPGPRPLPRHRVRLLHRADRAHDHRVRAAGSDVVRGYDSVTVLVDPRGPSPSMRRRTRTARGTRRRTPRSSLSGLGVPLDAVRVRFGDTAAAALRDGDVRQPERGRRRAAPRGRPPTACDPVLRIAGHVLEASPRGPGDRQGRIEVRGSPGSRMTVAEVARALSPVGALPRGLGPATGTDPEVRRAAWDRDVRQRDPRGDRRGGRATGSSRSSATW